MIRHCEDHYDRRWLRAAVTEWVMLDGSGVLAVVLVNVCDCRQKLALTTAND